MTGYYAELIALCCDADARTTDEFIDCIAATVTLEFAMCGSLVEVDCE